MSTERPFLQVAVVMRKERIDGPMSRWQAWRWVLDDVVPMQPTFGHQPVRLYQNESMERWLHPGYRVELYKDDAEGYYLNGTTAAPCWFVMWRMQEQATAAEEALAEPLEVSLSYHEAGRWLDAQEMVEQVAAAPDVVQWMLDFAHTHYQLEPKKRRRPESFRPLTDRFGNPASVSTEKRRGAGEHG